MKQLKQLQRKPRKNSRGFQRDYKGAMLYQLSYEALLGVGQEGVQFIPMKIVR